MARNRRSFCSLARHYALLERMAFGRRLQQARTAFLDQIPGLKTILIVGEGDGRFLEAILSLKGQASINCIDVSPGMIDRARRRIRGVYPDSEYEVNWQCRDVFETQLEVASLDAVVTHFLLDCFKADEAADLIRRLGLALRPRGLWFWSDFVIPGGRWPAVFARTYQSLLYRFFRWQTGITARRLPPVPDLMEQNGMSRSTYRRFLTDTIESAVWVKS